MEKSRESEIMKKLARALIDTYGMAEANELLTELSAIMLATVNNALNEQRKKLRAELKARGK